MGARERGSLLAVAFLVGSVALAAVPAADGSQRMAIARGKIVDQDGNPLQGVTVWIEYWYMGPRLRVGAGPTAGRDTITSTNIRRSGNKRQTKEDGTLTVRNRDDASQERIDKSRCLEYLRDKLGL